jgi:methionyl-tRNA formyltransferase
VRVVYLTTNDPLYLPAFFARVLDSNGVATEAVYVAPPLYKGQSSAAAARRYLRTFGWRDTVALARRTAGAVVRRRSIAEVCRAHGVDCRPVPDVNDPGFLEALRALDPDVVVSVSCPQVFERGLIDLPRQGCLNVHGALLPAYRGVMPSFWMLANGETRAGVSVFFVDERVDGGDLCGQRAFDIAPEETLDHFLRRSKAIAADLVAEVLASIENGTVTRTALNLADGSYYSWPTPEAVERFRARGRRLW